MTTVFKGTPKFDGISGDYARVTEFRGHESQGRAPLTFR